jgi:tetratricopeptide (TPR) repeat protein
MPDRLPQLLQLHDADPADTFVTYGIGIELMNADKPGEALPWFDKTIQLDRSYHYAYFQKARALSAIGEDTAAIEAATAGLTVAQQDGDAKAAGELEALRDELR